LTHRYAKYSEIDKEQLQKDIDEIKEKIGAPTEEDFTLAKA